MSSYVPFKSIMFLAIFLIKTLAFHVLKSFALYHCWNVFFSHPNSWQHLRCKLSQTHLFIHLIDVNHLTQTIVMEFQLSRFGTRSCCGAPAIENQLLDMAYCWLTNVWFAKWCQTSSMLPISKHRSFGLRQNQVSVGQSHLNNNNLWCDMLTMALLILLVNLLAINCFGSKRPPMNSIESIIIIH